MALRSAEMAAAAREPAQAPAGWAEAPPQPSTPQGAPVVAAAAFCTQCGARLQEGARFCGQCGAPVATATAAEHRDATLGSQPRAAVAASWGAGTADLLGLDDPVSPQRSSVVAPPSPPVARQPSRSKLMAMRSAEMAAQAREPAQAPAGWVTFGS